MISVPGIQLARITAAIGRGEPLFELSVRAARAGISGGQRSELDFKIIDPVDLL